MSGSCGWIRVLQRALVLAAMSATGLFCLLLGPQPVRAEVIEPSSPGCNATINGVDAAAVRFTREDAIHVKEHTSVSVTMQMPAPVHRRQIFLSFGVGPELLVSDETDPSSITTQVAVDKYATYGVGLYGVRVTASDARANTCAMRAIVQVEGNPLATVAGGGAAGLEVLSLLGIGAAAFGGANPGEAGTGADPSPDGSSRPEDFFRDPLTANTPEEAFDRTASLLTFGWCALAALPALILTSAAMAGGAAPGGAGVRLQRVHWRPRFSILGMFSGVLGGLAAVVLLQQTGRLFPSYEILGRALVAGLLAGILIPSLTRLIAVRRANRRVAAREAEINRAITQRTAAPGWVATHRAGTAGAPAYPQPDSSTAQTTTFTPGTALRVLELRGTWARVQSVDGRDGWVELTAMERMT
jgi:hypothetical protein